MAGHELDTPIELAALLCLDCYARCHIRNLCEDGECPIGRFSSFYFNPLFIYNARIIERGFMLLILFGLSGSGKNYVGRILRDEYGMHFYDADTDLTPAMQDAIRDQRVIPDAARDAFFQRLVERIEELRKREENLVVSQAIYKEKHREQILRSFPDAQFVWVRAPLDVIAQRLARRTDNPATLAYAEKILSIFEPPRIRHFALDNAGGREDVKQQIEQILAQIHA